MNSILINMSTIKHLLEIFRVILTSSPKERVIQRKKMDLPSLIRKKIISKPSHPYQMPRVIVDYLPKISHRNPNFKMTSIKYQVL